MQQELRHFSQHDEKAVTGSRSAMRLAASRYIAARRFLFSVKVDVLVEAVYGLA